MEAYDNKTELISNSLSNISNACAFGSVKPNINEPESATETTLNEIADGIRTISNNVSLFLTGIVLGEDDSYLAQ